MQTALLIFDANLLFLVKISELNWLKSLTFFLKKRNKNLRAGIQIVTKFDDPSSTMAIFWLAVIAQLLELETFKNVSIPSVKSLGISQITIFKKQIDSEFKQRFFIDYNFSDMFIKKKAKKRFFNSTACVSCKFNVSKRLF